MRTSIPVVALAFLALAIGACKEKETTSLTPATKEAPAIEAPHDQKITDTEVPTPVPTESGHKTKQLPTVVDFEDEAEDEITESNYETALLEIEKELEEE